MIFFNSWQNYQGNYQKLQIFHFQPFSIQTDICLKNINLGEQILISTIFISLILDAFYSLKIFVTSLHYIIIDMR